MRPCTLELVLSGSPELEDLRVTCAFDQAPALLLGALVTAIEQAEATGARVAEVEVGLAGPRGRTPEVIRLSANRSRGSANFLDSVIGTSFPGPRHWRLYDIAEWYGLGGLVELRDIVSAIRSVNDWLDLRAAAPASAPPIGSLRRSKR